MQELTSSFQQQSVAGYVSFATAALWLIPAVPMVASGVIALLKQPRRKLAATLAIGSLRWWPLHTFWPGGQIMLRYAKSSTSPGFRWACHM